METVMITVKKATQENVDSACAGLAKEGLKTTVNAVRARIGGGSPNDVAPMVKAWKQKQPKVAPQEITLAPNIARLIAQQMAAYAADLLHAAEARAAEAEENVQSLSEAGQLLELQVARLQAELDACRSREQQLAGQLAERNYENEVLRSDSRAAVQASEAKAADERAIAEGLRQQLVHAQIRNESVVGLQEALAETQRQLKAATDAVAGALQSAAVSDTRALAVTERAQQAEAREAALRGEIAQLRDQVARGQASTEHLAATLGKVSADLAAAVERKEPIKQAADEISAQVQLRDGGAAGLQAS